MRFVAFIVVLLLAVIVSFHVGAATTAHADSGPSALEMLVGQADRIASALNQVAVNLGECKAGAQPNTIRGVACSADGKAVYAALGLGIFKSEDGGATFRQILPPLEKKDGPQASATPPASSAVSAVAAAPPASPTPTEAKSGPSETAGKK